MIVTAYALVFVILLFVVVSMGFMDFRKNKKIIATLVAVLTVMMGIAFFTVAMIIGTL